MACRWNFKISANVFLACGSNPQTPDKSGPMVQIQLDSHTFYMDQYEYPNQKGSIPESEMDLNTAIERCSLLAKDFGNFRGMANCLWEKTFIYGDEYKDDSCQINQHLEEVSHFIVPW